MTAQPSVANGQHEAIAFLERGAGGGPPRSADRIDTHVSSVFLIGDRAYKLKRAVRFSYLDFSTLARREEACRAEVRLNSRTAPELYLGVHAITRERDGGCTFDGGGPVLDYVVAMQRFEQDALLDRMAERGALDEGVTARLSEAIADFHARAEPTPGLGGAASLGVEIDGNAQNLALAPTTTFEPARCAALAAAWRVELERQTSVLDRRDREGRVRRCHGDLHLRNIVVWRGRPALFDCIEFSEHLSCIDVLYDLAFLLMDLEHRGLRAQANAVLNGYLDRNDEADGLAALPLMMSLRAGIRAHISAAAARAQSHPERAEAIAVEARAYLALAEELLRPSAPRLIAIGGLSGSGKSTLARALAPLLGRAPGARVLHTDAIRKALFGRPPTAPLEPAAYASEVSAQVYQRQRAAAVAALRAGVSVVADGVHAQPDERAAIAQAAESCGAPFVGLWLQAPTPMLRERIAARVHDISDADVAVLDLQLGHDVGPLGWTIVHASGERTAVLARAREAVHRLFQAQR